MDRYHPENAVKINLTDPTNLHQIPYDPEIVIGGMTGGGLLPGGTLELKITLNSSLFDMSPPGTYYVQVERMDDMSKSLVKSNTVTFTVSN